MNTRMIEVENLSFSYGRRKSMVLEDFSMKLDKGSVYGLLGKNGTGKSTLLYLMAGLLRPQQGNVIYQGMEVITYSFLLSAIMALILVTFFRYTKKRTIPFVPFLFGGFIISFFLGGTGV